ncbi:MAG: hypothetical protein IPH76_11735 [Xanthomonadales bacterium]|nr:hypothetical protein [Xanthomonadales bacterium]
MDALFDSLGPEWRASDPTVATAEVARPSHHPLLGEGADNCVVKSTPRRAPHPDDDPPVPLL